MRLTNWITKRQKDFMPLSLTVIGTCISAAAIVIALAWKPGDFAVNVLAALALIGPGLVITNMLVGRYESARAKKEIERRTAPMFMLLLTHFNDFIVMGNDFLEMITAAIRNENAEAHGFTTMPPADSLADARSAINLLYSTVTYLDADPPPGTSRQLTLPSHPLEFPDVHGLLHVIERIDRDVPMPHSVLAAHRLLSYTNRVGLDFYDHYPNTSIYRQEGEEWIFKPVEPTKVGFVEAGAYAYPPYGSDRAAARSVDIIKYAECLMNSLYKAGLLIEMIEIEAPKNMLPKERFKAVPDVEEP